jgi:excisionase family DNA binding protein
MTGLLTPREVAQRLRCSLPQVYAMSSRGTLPKVKIGSKLLFREEDVDDFVAGCWIEAREPVEL